MKSIKQLAYVGAIALIGAGFVACNNNEPEKTETNEGVYSGETVKTQFMIQIAENVASANKRFMQGTEVQNAGTRASFRGMDSIVLIPFDADSTTRIGKNITLDAISKDAAITAGSLNNKNSIFYEDVAIPLGTKRFLFYGKAIDNTAGAAITSDADKHKFGTVTPNGLYNATNNPADITFSLNSIYSETTTPATATKLAEYVTNIASAKDASDNAWSAHTNSAVKKLYDEFITLTAGSSFSVLQTVQDLYNTLERFQETQVTADAVVAAVMDSIKVGADVTTENKFSNTLTLKSELQSYPDSIHLPEGAAKIKWETSKFVVDNPAVGDLSMTELNQIVYPASLLYYGESTIKTSANSRKNLYDGNTEWDDIIKDENYEETEVKSATKSVAIVNPINYAVGQLRTTVKRADALKDQKDSTYTITQPLKWTALLIGNQKVVNSDFTQKETETNTYTIYDNYLTTTGDSVELTTSASAVNYTLVFSTKDNDDKQDAVNIAIELVNTNATFFGNNGQIIPAGSKFYLVGKLKVADTYNGAAPTKNNIFYKDYYTTANFTITSLANAYNTIPDLRSEGLELGFSVDLAWQEGLSFDVEL